MVLSTSNLVETFTVRYTTGDTLSRSVGQLEIGSRNMAEIQFIQCKNQQKSPKYRAL